MFPFVSSLLSLGAPNRFSSVWDANLKTAVAATTTSPEYPAHCKLAVVGAGWGGAYFAWRMAVDTKTVDAKDVCVFEANGRVGGRGAAQVGNGRDDRMQHLPPRQRRLFGARRDEAGRGPRTYNGAHASRLRRPHHLLGSALWVLSVTPQPLDEKCVR